MMSIRPQKHRPLAPITKRHLVAPAQTNRQTGRTLHTGVKAWRDMRAYALSTEPLCRKCSERGDMTPATDLDHIDGDATNNNAANLQPLCKRCHSRKSAIEENGFADMRAAILPRWLPETAKPLFVVCGPPGAGKTTHVRSNATDADLIIDLDSIALELSGKPLQELGAQGRVVMMRERNSRLADYMAGKTSHTQCWLIATAGSYKQRLFWETKGATIIVIHPGVDECRRRIMTDRPMAIQASQLAAVNRWR